jgi:hypothetical protein
MGTVVGLFPDRGRPSTQIGGLADDGAHAVSRRIAIAGSVNCGAVD